MTKEENEKRLEHLRGIVSNLPSKPGSYQYYDREGTIIYVGKAKNLKNRVSSYFHKEVDRYKTKVLVSKIWDITYTVVNTEEDALLLENNLIKKYQPKYNILLKDGKRILSKNIQDKGDKQEIRHLLRPLQSYRHDVCAARRDKEAVQAPHLSPASHRRGHTPRQIPSLSGLPHK